MLLSRLSRPNMGTGSFHEHFFRQGQKARKINRELKHEIWWVAIENQPHRPFFKKTLGISMHIVYNITR